jgi:asparagine synthetase B (glutamine-hydrolysing)
MDFKLTQTMSQIPEKYLLHGMNDKWALRNIAKKYLPEEIWNHHKHPFFAPMKYLYLKDAREGMRDYIEVAKINTPWLNWKNIERILEHEKLGSSSSHVDTVISMKLILFSTGVLISELKNPTHTEVRGYKLPQNIEDIKLFRKRA